MFKKFVEKQLVSKEERIRYFVYKGTEREECRDVFSGYEFSFGTLLFLSDGVSSKRYSAEGAGRLHHRITEMLDSLEEFSLMTAKELRYRIACKVKETMYLLGKEYGCEKEEFASTLIMAIIPEQGDEVWAIHLGDGLIGCVDKNSQISVWSHPQNGITKQYTYTTAMGNVYEWIRVKQQRKPEILFAMTDGATEILWKNEKFEQKYGEMILRREWNMLYETLVEQTPGDDIGFFAWINPDAIIF